jgi:hypothetical protein
MGKIALAAITLATALSAIPLACPVKAQVPAKVAQALADPKLSQALSDPKICWQFQGSDITGDEARRLLSESSDPNASVTYYGSDITLYYVGAADGRFHTGRFYKTRCPGKPAPASAAAGIYFDGLQVSFDVGSMSGRMGITNQQQFTLCNPQQFALCTPDRTPNAAADLTGSSIRGAVALEYLFWEMAIPGTNLPLLFGPEVLVGFGSSSSTISTIPGTFGDGGIATPAAAAHDSTSVRFGNSFGVLGEVGTILTVGNVPLFVAFDGGVGWQRTDLTFNCTTLGACGTNGIPAQSLTNSQTLSGSLLGGKIKAPLIALFPAANGGFLSGSSIGFQYLRGDYGNVGTTLGTPAQIQITANQHVTTDSFMGTLSVPLLPSTVSRPKQRLFLP